MCHENNLEYEAKILDLFIWIIRQNTKQIWTRAENEVRGPSSHLTWNDPITKKLIALYSL